MVKKIKKPEQLPEWFKLEKYDALKELTARELLEQLSYRTYSLSVLDDGEFPNNCEDYTSQIMSGKVILEEDFFGGPNGNKVQECNKDKNLNNISAFLDFVEPNLSGEDAAYPMNCEDLKMFDTRARDLGIYTDSKDSPFAHPEHRYLSVSQLSSEKEGLLDNELSASQTLALLLALGEYTDEEIIATLARRLPLWRAELNIPEPKLKKTRIGMGTISKIITDQIIPAMDLMIWERFDDSQITQILLTRTLFPGTLRSDVLQTLKRGVATVCSSEYERSLSVYLTNNPDLCDLKVSSCIELLKK